ncbi:pyridoxamine 5'-phosphate oxidase [Labilibaculum sp.]|uniref:pyridoxamine 5'-phosphate oxidase n=1 Tax=Labilibaculum sp. TaxID=2060723 RepID=UPI00356252E3
MNKDIKKLRHEYGQRSLTRSEINSNPFTQFRIWFEEAVKMQLPDANAMTLATVSPDNRPSARILLLKDFSEKGFCFFTNYQSRKGKDIDKNAYGALVFFWPELERQIRIEGKITKLKAEDSNQYFFERPIGSRMAASVSPQSTEIENRESLIEMMNQFENEHGTIFNRPDFWGGYQLQPDLFEFWQGRENRLNDRIEYTLENKKWKHRRLAP